MDGFIFTLDFQALLLGAIYIGLILLVGYAGAFVFLKPGQRHWLELIGLSFAGGAAVLSLLQFVISLARIKPNRWTLLAAALVSITLIASRKKQGLLSPSIPWPRRKPDPLLLLGALSLVLILACIASVSARAGWSVMEDVDALAIWIFKAKWVALKPLVPIAPEFLDPTLSFSHQDYPLGYPFLVAGLFTIVGRVDDTLVRILLLPTYLSLIAVIYAAVRSHHRRAVALTLTAVFIAGPNLTAEAGASIPETFLILNYACALFLLLNWIDCGHRGELMLSGLFIAALAFTKNEGLALMPVLGFALFCWALFKPDRRSLADWLCAAGFTLLLIAPWLIYRTHLPRTHEDYGGKLTHVTTIMHNLPRLSYVLPACLGLLFNFKTTGPLMALLLLVAIVCHNGFRRGPILLLWCVLIVQILLYVAAFVVTPWDVHLLLPMVTPRLLTQAFPVMVLLISLHLREFHWTVPASVKTSV